MTGGNDRMWGVLIHLGMNQWHDHFMSEIKRAGVWAKCPGEEYLDHIRAQYCTADHVRFDEAVWREVSARYAECGVNTIVLDLGEAVAYPSRPELAVKGSWAPEKLRAELDRLRGMGFEVVPKLNFSTSHDAWLKDYHRMVSTDEYYDVCSDVIRDACEIFGGPRLFHIGFDEERPQHHKNDQIAIARQGMLWWHDLKFLSSQVESRGARTWMWVDHIVKDSGRTLVYDNLPKSVLVSPWYYQDVFDPGETWEIKAMHDLDAHGYDMVPCGSTCFFTDDSMERLSAYCEARFNRSRLKGYLCAPWLEMCEYFKPRLLLAGESTGRARRACL